MDHLKIILTLIIVLVAVWVRFGGRLKYYFRNRLKTESGLEPKKDLPLFLKPSYDDYLESVRLASIKKIYAFTDPGKTKSLDGGPVDHRLLFINGELAGYTENYASRSGETLKFYALEHHRWNEDADSKATLLSLVSTFKHSYHALEKDTGLLSKYRELTEPFIQFIPAANFALLEQKLNIEFPEELTYGLSTVGFSGNWLSHPFETKNLDTFTVNLRFSDAFVYHMLEQFPAFNGFSPEEQTVLSKHDNGLKGLIWYYYYDLEYTSVAEFELRGTNFLRHCLATYNHTDDEPVMQVASFSGIGESNDYLILDTSRAGYFWSDLTYEENDLNGVKNPVYKLFEYADNMNILKTEILERNYLIKLLLG